MKAITDINDIYILENRFNKQHINRYKSNNNTMFQNIPTDNIDYYIIKPQGRKCYLWFTYINKEFIALLKFINDNTFYRLDLTFDNTLSYNNVLLCGYYLKFLDNYYFIIDDVINYNDYNYVIENMCSLDNKFKLYIKILDYINNSMNNIRVFLPFITDNYNKIFDAIYNLAYNPYAVSIWSKNKNIGIYTLINNSNTFEEIFKITAHPNNDTYNLYCFNNNTLEYYDRALITDYRLSVYMNSLFRNIVENNNLDLLEESDTEENFENIDEYKYVDLNKSYYFKCIYNKRFRKWVPKILIKNIKDSDIVKKNKLRYIEKK